MLMEEKIIEVEQLATLSLPSHPDSLAGVKDAMTMQEKERAALLVTVLCIQIVHALRREGSEGI